MAGCSGAEFVPERAPGAFEVFPVPFGGVLDGADADHVVVGGFGCGDVLAVGDADQHVGGEQRADGADGGEDLNAVGACGGGHQTLAPVSVVMLSAALLSGAYGRQT